MSKTNILDKWRSHIGVAALEIIDFCERRGWSVELFQIGGEFLATISDTGTKLAEGSGKQASKAIHSAYASWKRNGQPIKVSAPVA